MKKKPSTAAKMPEARAPLRVRTSMIINRDKLTRVRRVLGTKTDTEAVEKAMDVVLGNAEISLAIDQAFGRLPKFEVS